jgi:ribosomal protein S18 acetylase RimI-like enzyme
VTPSEAGFSLSIGTLTEEDFPRAVAVLARAFRDNPLNVAVIGSRHGARRLRSNTYGMGALLPVAREHGHLMAARADGEIAGALVAAPPYGYPLPAPPLRTRLRCLAGQGWRVARRWAVVFHTLDALHPLEPHWYLGSLGVDPRFQGMGVGTALLETWVALADRDGVPAYLETDLFESVGFYARVGFAVEGETEVLGARIWRMMRRAGARRVFPKGPVAE